MYIELKFKAHIDQIKISIFNFGYLIKVHGTLVSLSQKVIAKRVPPKKPQVGGSGLCQPILAESKLGYVFRPAKKNGKESIIMLEMGLRYLNLSLKFI